MEEGSLPSLNYEIGAVIQLSVGQMLDESLWAGSLMGAEAATQSSRWFRYANSSEHNTNER
jgi:hypothetical protein